MKVKFDYQDDVKIKIRVDQNDDINNNDYYCIITVYSNNFTMSLTPSKSHSILKFLAKTFNFNIQSNCSSYEFMHYIYNHGNEIVLFDNNTKVAYNFATRINTFNEFLDIAHSTVSGYAY